MRDKNVKTSYDNASTLDSDRVLLSIQDRCNQWISEQKSRHIDTMYAHIKSGKMLRSKLILAILPLESYANQTDKILDLCAIVELIQCASLLHDDVIDEADTRRGRASINVSFGNKNAIMLGDVLYSNAYVKLCDFEPSITSTIAQAVSHLARGEIEDVSYSGNFQPDLEIYYRILSDKTASLIAACAKAAALFGGLDSGAYEAYGYNLGMAFQVVDDILDITQDKAILGKPAMNDVREGKSTLPYILLYHTLSSNEKEHFLRLFTKADEKSIAALRNMLLDSSALAESKQIAQDFIQKAKQAIAQENNARLIQIAQAMIERNF